MPRFRKIQRILAAIIASCLSGVAALSVPHAAAAAAATPASTPFHVNWYINGLASVSAADTWAVGETGEYGNMVLEHWNGTRWTRDPAIGSAGALEAIAMDSPTDGWAVGETTPSSGLPVWAVFHWNGKTWRQDASAPKIHGHATTVAIIGGDVWVGGEFWEKPETGPNGNFPLETLHRTAGHWYVTPVPFAASSFVSLAPLARSSVWALAQTFNPPVGYQGKLLHWNGVQWKTTGMPAWASQADFSDLESRPGGSVWGVAETNSAPYQALSMRWTGKSWAHVAVPAAAQVYLYRVAPAPGGTAWAVGNYTASNNATHPVILHWSGKAWTNAWIGSADASLRSVIATSATNAWAIGLQCVGKYCDSFTMVVLHWNGKTWTG